jgi:hypothetical protein
MRLFPAIIVFGIVSSFLIITFTQVFAFRTHDDSKEIPALIESQSFRNVLGANSNDSGEDYCPSSKPVIGWVDFEGNKRIMEFLPVNQEASACFRTEEEAKEAGFKYEYER